MAKKRRTTTKEGTRRKANSNKNGQRKCGRKLYPVMTFAEVLPLAQGIMEHAAGQPIRRLTLLKKLEREANTDATRRLITNSGKYGLTQGGHGAEEIKLTEYGRTAVSENGSGRDRAEARFKLAIDGIEAFRTLYRKFKGNKSPAPEVMRDALEKVDGGDRKQCVDIFNSNAKELGLLRTMEGAQRLLSLDELYDNLPSKEEVAEADGQSASSSLEESSKDTDFDNVCFFIAPIGSEDDEQRKHSDMILSSFVEHALEDQNLRVVRADRITKPGMISKQVIEYILQSKLVVADLSFQNPNVFYELALRHVTGKPTVHLIRKEDKIPFDVGNFRTITIDMGCKYDLVASLETYRSDIANQVRQALANGVSKDNPILTFFPDARIEPSAQG